MIAAVALVAIVTGLPGHLVASRTPESTPVRGPSATLEVSVDTQACPSVSRAELQRIISLELDSRSVEPDRSGPHTTRVSVTCSDAEVRLAVVDPITGKQLFRAMAVRSLDPAVGARMVALAAAELVLTSWAELNLARASATATSGGDSQALRQAALERVRRQLPPTERHTYVLALGQAIGPFRGVGTSWGGGLRVGWSWARALLERPWARMVPAADVDVVGTRTTAHTAEGDVSVNIWSVTLRGSLRLGTPHVWAELGGGARAGLARLEGSPADASTTRGGTLAATWTGPIAYAGLGFRVWHLVLAPGVEAGYVLRTIDGVVDNGSPVSLAGPFVAATVALGWGD
jgi:hypothetical protein